MKRLIFTACLVLAGCANPGVVQLAPDTYMLTRTDKGGIFGNASAMKADVIREANEFAASKGKVAVPLFVNEQPLQVGRSFATVEYQFRVVDASDPENRRSALRPIQPEQTVNVRTKDETAKRPDLYTELLKLEDLHKRGVLTDAEFTAAKQRLLAAQ